MHQLVVEILYKGKAQHYNVLMHLAADYNQLYAAFKVAKCKAAISTLDDVEKCIKSVEAQMVHSELQLNAAKTEFLLVMSP